HDPSSSSMLEKHDRSTSTMFVNSLWLCQAESSDRESRHCAHVAVHCVGGTEGVAGAGGVTATGSTAALFTKSFSSLLGLKKGIFLAGTSTLSPVLGLRPTRGFRWRVRKLPKPRISILSPTRSERTMLSKIVSTITSLSLRVSSASRDTSSIRSAFVIRSLRSLFRRYESLYCCGFASAAPATLEACINFSDFGHFAQVPAGQQAQ